MEQFFGGGGGGGGGGDRTPLMGCVSSAAVCFVGFLGSSDVKYQRSLIVFTNRASQRIGASRLDR